MFGAFERLMASRYLRARRQEGFISVIAWFSLLGIAIGVATLIIVMAVMNGFRDELLGRILGINGHMTVLAEGQLLSDYDKLSERIAQVPGVKQALPYVEGQVMAMGEGRASGALVRGVKPSDLAKRELIAGKIVLGKLGDFEGIDAIVLGNRLAAKLGLTVGDRITLVAPQNVATAFGNVPRQKAFTIVATFEIGMFEYDSSYAFITLEAAQLYFRLGDTVNAIEVMVDEPGRVERWQGPVSRALTGPARLRTWQHTNSHFFAAVQVERNVMFLILSLIILVAAFNIISSMIMLVKDKGRDIAILRTMGATAGAIMRIFIMAGASVGVIGTVVGFVLGVTFCHYIDEIKKVIEKLTGTGLFPAEIYFLSRMPAKMESNETIMVLVMALALSFLATLYPSWRAARLDPVEALRYE
jgi:lipoprotein-releasing system permease protein